MQEHLSTDETLVLLTLAGDSTAYESLVNRHQASVIASANRVLHSRYLAEDAAQDAFITAWMKLNHLQSPEKFGAWVCRIAVNCAKNMIVRYRPYLPLDELEEVIADTPDTDPVHSLASKETTDAVRSTVSRLPARVGEIIRMHYIESLSVAEIAMRLGLSEGTVKWQLHDGRRRMRGELCAMNETMNDTLTRRVMKKVEELKRWQYQNNKNGFEEIHRETLSAVEDLPEVSDTQEKTKYSAMADVLMRGWWWIPGTKNDALFARIKEAAIRGHNEEVMAFIVSTEDQKMWGTARIDYMKNVQIPMLEKNGYTKALAQEWFWLGEVYSDEGDAANAIDAFDHALRLTGVDDIYHAYAQAAKQMEQSYQDRYTDKPEKTYRMRAGAQKLFIESGLPRRYNDYWYGKGLLCSADTGADFIFTNASLCDGYFTVPNTEIGHRFVGSDGTILTYLRDNETVTVPAGTFAGCQVWQTRRSDAVYLTYFVCGVGIVRQERTFDGITEVRNLSSYSVRGDGLLPLVTGNTWDYTTEHAPGTFSHVCRHTVSFADETGAVIGYIWELERLCYDENSWFDMILRIRNDYWDGEHVQDVTPYMERAKALAKTPAEIAHTAAACSVAQRIMDTDCNLHPDTSVTGHWNFFARNTARRSDDGQRITLDGNFLWSFELKNINTAASQQLIYNDVLDIFNNDCGCIWDDAWVAGSTHTVSYLYYNTPIKTEIVCENASTLTTAAGAFDHCLHLCIDTHGFEAGMEYRGGKKIYTFAPGIGIIRAENCNAIGSRSVVYELTAYEGVGDGYQPLVGGLMRRYALLDPTDGYIGAVEYTYAEDNGAIAIFENRTGIRRKPDAVTEYAYIEREQEEERLWDAGKHEESRALHAQNNIHLFAYFLGRPSRYWAVPDKAVAWHKYRLQILENTGIDGTVPRAWLGFYAATCFRLACALFGMGQKEEGYDYLERSFAPMEQWMSFGADEKLEFGDPLIWGDIGIVRGGEELILSDGTREPLSYETAYLFEENPDLFHYAMTAKQGWEWFDSVRDEERFKAYIPRARALNEIK